MASQPGGGRDGIPTLCESLREGKSLFPPEESFLKRVSSPPTREGKRGGTASSAQGTKQSVACSSRRGKKIFARRPACYEEEPSPVAKNPNWLHQKKFPVGGLGVSGNHEKEERDPSKSCLPVIRKRPSLARGRGDKGKSLPDLLQLAMGGKCLPFLGERKKKAASTKKEGSE